MLHEGVVSELGYYEYSVAEQIGNITLYLL